MSERARYTIILEEGKGSWGASVEEMPGCVAVSETREDVLQLIHESIEFHEESDNEAGAFSPLG